MGFRVQVVPKVRGTRSERSDDAAVNGYFGVKFEHGPAYPD